MTPCDLGLNSAVKRRRRGRAFYPFFSTRSDGGDFIPGTVNDFGGSSATEFTHLISQIFPGAGNTPITRFENLNSDDLTNPCPVGQ